MRANFDPLRISAKLKPCPFCGEKAYLATYYPGTEREYFVIECSGCGVQTLPDTRQNLVEIWNTRVHQ